MWHNPPCPLYIVCSKQWFISQCVFVPCYWCELNLAIAAVLLGTKLQLLWLNSQLPDFTPQFQFICSCVFSFHTARQKHPWVWFTKMPLSENCVVFASTGYTLGAHTEKDTLASVYKANSLWSALWLLPLFSIHHRRSLDIRPLDFAYLMNRPEELVDKPPDTQLPGHYSHYHIDAYLVALSVIIYSLRWFKVRGCWMFPPAKPHLNPACCQ